MGNRVKKVLKFSVWVAVILVVLITSGGAALWYVWSSNLPYIGSLREYNPSIITEVYAEGGEVIGRFWEEKRIVVSLETLPKYLINAFIAAEDARFYQHEGLDLASIVRAFIKNVTAGKIEQGGSTITQQVTKSLLLKNPEKTYKRKVREAILSLQIEKEFTKERLLFLYLNQIYLGHGAYGVEAAARTYFNKNGSDLSLAECALLAGLPQAPSRYSPMLHFERAKARQKYVLQRMKEEGFVTQLQAEKALAAEISLADREENAFEKAPYFTEHIRRYLEEKYGRELLYTGGLKVYSTLELDKQRTAQAALNKGLLELDKREGYRGPVKHLAAEETEAFKRETVEKLTVNPPKPDDLLLGVVEKVDDPNKVVIVRIGDHVGRLPLSEMKWARKPDPEVPYYAAAVKTPSQVLQVGDVILVRIKDLGTNPDEWLLSLEQEPRIQGAVFCMEAQTGRVKAMVGGRDFAVSQFNRAIQARRQPGSAFKPIIYAAALDGGMNPATVILDAPYVSTMNPDEEELWRPKNYMEKFYGPTLFRSALIHSRNVITVKILKEIGIRNAIEYARRMGIESDLSPDLSLALGSSGLSLMEITRAYTPFANGGVLVEPIFLNRIEDRTGRIVEERQPFMRECISKETAYVMTDLLAAAVKEGTGWRAKALKRPAAGKTGTTNDLRDAWFLGFTPGLLAGVWVGYDDRKPMGKGETGSRAACPIWVYFMSAIMEGRPVEDFAVPEKVVFAKIDAKTGFLASPYSEETVFQAFRSGEEPKGYSPKPHAPKTGNFLQFDMEKSQ